jgi:hypothetical protein
MVGCFVIGIQIIAFDDNFPIKVKSAFLDVELSKWFTLFLAMKVFVVIFVYLKRFKTFADLFDSVEKSLVLVQQILSMYGVLLLMWAGVFIALLGGNVTDQTQEYLKTKYEVTVSEGDLMYNFNDYLYGIVTMFMIS